MGRKSLIKQGPNSWMTFKKDIANILIEALKLLRQRSDLVKDERELNRLLYHCLGQANLHFGLPMPAYDARNPPHLMDEQKAKREDNRPDFYWTLMDHEAKYQDWYRTFALECKRLGQKSDGGWVFNEHYVTDGILRFFLVDKGYGKGCETGAMVAYIQDMELEEILSEVNAHLSRNEPSIPLLAVLSIGWQQQGVSCLHHTFSRSYNPSLFFLQHFWIDMKDCLYLPSSLDMQEIVTRS
jgi:hypothetical protein